MEGPSSADEEVSLERRSTLCVVEGSIDLIIGSTVNGRRPRTVIRYPLNYSDHDEQPSASSGTRAEYLGSLLETKSSAKPLSPLSHSTSTFTSKTEKSEDILQPMLTLLAVGEVTVFKTPRVAILHLLCNAYSY